MQGSTTSTETFEERLGRMEALVQAGASVPPVDAGYLLAALRAAQSCIDDVRKRVGSAPKGAKKPKAAKPKAEGISYAELLSNLRKGFMVVEPSNAPGGYYARVTKQAQAYKLTPAKCESLGRWLALDPWWSKREVSVQDVVNNLAKWLPKAEALGASTTTTDWEEVTDDDDSD
jgi:hypothetical protein